MWPKLFYNTSLWNSFREKIDDVDGNSFGYKTKIVGNTSQRPGNEGDANQLPVPTLNVEFIVPLKFRSNICRSIDFSLINCDIEIDLAWTKDYVLIEQNNNITGV